MILQPSSSLFQICSQRQHIAKMSMTKNFFKFRPSLMCAVAIFKLFIIKYIYYISQRTVFTIRYCKNTKKIETQKKKTSLFTFSNLSSSPLFPCPPLSDATRQSPPPHCTKLVNSAKNLYSGCKEILQFL